MQTRNKRDASILKKEYDRRFALEQATGDSVSKPKRILLKDAISEYLRYKKQNFAARTYQTDKQRLTWVLDFTGNIPLSRISTNTIVDYVEFRMESVKPSTIRITLICWKAFMNYCLKRKYIRENPFIMYPIEKIQNRVAFLPLEEIKQLQRYKDETRPWLPLLINLDWFPARGVSHPCMGKHNIKFIKGNRKIGFERFSEQSTHTVGA